MSLGDPSSQPPSTDKKAWAPVQAVSTFRTTLPQILASTVKNLLLIDIGMAIAFPTIVIPALTGLQPDKYTNGTIQFTAQQATWYGSLGFIGQPLGSAISGWITEPFGRKRSMMLVNIPHIAAWTLMYFATSHLHMYAAVILIGFGTGIMEAPILTYVSEISQPSLRGILLSCSLLATMLGFLIVFVLGTVTTWQNAALVCLVIPIASVVALYFIPETPYWLLSKNRKYEALKSLQWLRGWVSPEAVSVEFTEIERCIEMNNACFECRLLQIKCKHPPPSLKNKLHELMQIGTRRPFYLLTVAFFIMQFSGLSAARPFFVQLFQAFNVPLNPNIATVLIAVVNILSNVVYMCFLKFLGKRKLYLFTLGGCILSSYSIGMYAFLTFPPEYSSFDKHPQQLASGNYFALYMFCSLAFFSNLGMYPVTFTLLSEVFPFKTRGIATGIVMAVNYVFSFISVKTFFDVEHFLSIAGMFTLYGTVTVFGFCYMFVFMPETENRTLEELERYFSDVGRRQMDRRIGVIRVIPNTVPSHLETKL